ncbi:MAG: hypothetical protein U0359_11630 [Byssovorax sp.]
MQRRSISSLLAASALAAVPLLAPADARALIQEGERAPSAQVPDVDGKLFDLRAARGKPVLIVYEDRDSANQNAALKSDLGKLAKGDAYRSKVALAAVADVSSYDFWPARGFVIDAIREESKKQGTTIYCDWSGSFRKALKLRRGVSSVILFSRDGETLFATEGPVSKEGREKLIRLLKSQVEGS